MNDFELAGQRIKDFNRAALQSEARFVVLTNAYGGYYVSDESIGLNLTGDALTQVEADDIAATFTRLTAGKDEAEIIRILKIVSPDRTRNL